MPVVGACAAIFDEQGRILCVRQNSGIRKWTLPGGHVECGETPVEAVVREVREETGFIVEAGELIGVYSSPATDRLVLVLCATVLDRGLWRPGDEIIELGFFHRHALPCPMYERTQARIADAFDCARGIIRVFNLEAERKAS